MSNHLGVLASTSQSARSNFFDVTQQLSFPDPKLLMWSGEGRSVHPEATQLGADLLCAQELFKDLQTKYIADYDYVAC